MKNIITKAQIVALESEMNASTSNIKGTASQIAQAIDESEEKFHATILSYDNAKEDFMGNIIITLRGKDVSLYTLLKY